MLASYRGLWVSFLDFGLLDFGSRAAFVSSVRRLCDRCAQLELNHIILHLRPFGDALYPSAYFPWSHLPCGQQGQSPAFDPLEIIIREAAAYGIAVDGWLNPYRILRSDLFAGPLAAGNPALQHPSMTVQWQAGLYYNPASPAAVQLIADGARELADAYDLAAIQFDDYFYPTTDPAFDVVQYQQSATKLPLDDWRRNNVNCLVRTVFETIHNQNPAIKFGISPHGNDGINYCQQYSDTALWMREPGYLDFVLPQLYYGFEPTQQEGQVVCFPDSVAWWMSRPCHPQLSVYFGLPAYLSDEFGQPPTLPCFVTELQCHHAAGYAYFRATNLMDK